MNLEKTIIWNRIELIVLKGYPVGQKKEGNGGSQLPVQTHSLSKRVVSLSPCKKIVNSEVALAHFQPINPTGAGALRPWFQIEILFQVTTPFHYNIKPGVVKTHLPGRCFYGIGDLPYILIMAHHHYWLSRQVVPITTKSLSPDLPVLRQDEPLIGRGGNEGKWHGGCP